MIGRMSLSESTANAVLQVSKSLKVTACLTRWPAVASNIRTLRGPRWKACTTERWWDLWSRNKNWEWLPPGQQLRHRRQGDAVYLGDGMTNVKYNLIHHENLELKPTWKMYPDMYVELFLEGCYCTKERGWSDRYIYIYICICTFETAAAGI